MMTSNVFGFIAAENLGYAKVELAETIARGDGRCRVVVHLEPVSTEEEGEHGLGLAMCRKVVREHGGEIEVGEAGTGGAVFRFSLPAGAG